MLFFYLPFILFNLADMTAVSFFLIMCLWKDNSHISKRMKERKHSFITLFFKKIVCLRKSWFPMPTMYWTTKVNSPSWSLCLGLPSVSCCMGLYRRLIMRQYSELYSSVLGPIWRKCELFGHKWIDPLFGLPWCCYLRSVSNALRMASLLYSSYLYCWVIA